MKHAKPPKTVKEKYPYLHGKLNRVRDADTVKMLADYIRDSNRPHSGIVAECVRVGLPLIVSGKASAR